MERKTEVEKPEMGIIDDRKAGTEVLEGRADGTITERSSDEFGLNNLREPEEMVVRVAAANILKPFQQRSGSMPEWPAAF